MPSINDEFDLLSEEQWANLTDRKVQAVRNERAKGRGPAFVKIGRTVKYRRADVLAFIERSTVKPAMHPTLIDGSRRRTRPAATA